MTLRAEPLIPRWGVMVATTVVLAIMAYAVFVDNWIALVVLSLVLLFVLGADTTAMLRAWKGVPDPPDEPRVGPRP
jgi:hypothetical protein